MIRNYIKIGLRVLSRNKTFSTINIIGFAVGLTTSLMIFLFIKHELSFDQHLSKKDNLFRVVSKKTTEKGVEFNQSVPYPLTDALRNELLEDKKVVPVVFSSGQNIEANKQFYTEGGIVFTDSVFCDLFDVKVIQGKPSDLEQPGNVFLTKKLANKYFGTQNPVGKKIVLAKQMNLTVTGVIENPPPNTHLPYKMLISKKNLTEEYIGFEFDRWGTNLSMFATYVHLDNKPKENIAEEINKIYLDHYESAENEQELLMLQSIKDIHLDARYGSFDGAYTTSKKFIWIFSSVGLLILLIAMINFINLSIVQAIKRTKEVGLRKVLGASRKKLMYQFLSETLVIVILAEVIALIIVEIMLPSLNNQLGSMIQLNLYGTFDTILFLFIILIVVSISAGLFPSLVISKYKPVEAIRKKINSKKKKSIPAYKFLVIFQFFVTQILLISLLVINDQIQFLGNKDLGFETKNRIIVDIPPNDTDGFETFKNEVKQYPGIDAVSFALGAPLSRSSLSSSFKIPGDQKTYYTDVKFTDLEYLETFDIQLIAGEWFRHQSTETHEIVINKKLAEKFGYTQPDSIIGRTIKLWDEQNKIIGVTEDFHVKSLHEEMVPVIFYYWPKYFYTASIKLNSSNHETAISNIEEAFKSTYPSYLFDYKIFQDFLSSNYKNEQRTFSILKIFSLIAIILASMGLFGLVSFIMVQKTKEIGIRKAIGARSTEIVQMYVWQYLKYVLAASLFALPVAYYLMNRWLMDYAYHIKLSFGFFVIGILIVMVIAIVSILFQTIQSASTNPVNSLRYE
jgi:ABC-type antimicrobial peptide transport system permease subunit